MYYQQDEQYSHQEIYESMMVMPPHPLTMLPQAPYVSHQYRHHPSSPPPTATTVPGQQPPYMMSSPMCWRMGPMGSSITCLPSHHEMNDSISPSFCDPSPTLSLRQDSFYASMASSPSDFASPLNDPLYLHTSSPPNLNSLSGTDDNHQQAIFYSPPSSSLPSSSSSCMSPIPSPQSDALLLLQHCQHSATPVTTTAAAGPTAACSTLDSQGRAFQCPVCSRAFKRKHDLQRHVRVHTGDKPYSCLCCKKAFARTDALKRHLRMEEACRTSPVIQAMKCAGKRRYRNL